MAPDRPTRARRQSLRLHALALLATAAIATGCASTSPVVADDVASPPTRPAAPETATPTALDLEPCVYVEPITGTDGPPEGWSQETQELLMTWSMPVIDALGLGEDGFTLGYAPPTVTVLTPDPLPASLDGVVADAAAAGVTIAWQQTQYDMEELIRQTEVLFAALPQSAADITGVGPAPGGAGLRIYTATEVDDAGCAEIRSAAATAVPGVPISFQLMAASDFMDRTEVE